MPRYVSALVSEGCSSVAFRKACTAPGKSLLWNRSTPSAKAVFLFCAATQPAIKRRSVVIANRAVTRMVNSLREGLGAGDLGLVHRSHSTTLSDHDVLLLCAVGRPGINYVRMFTGQ
jgi:hypothetical protein